VTAPDGATAAFLPAWPFDGDDVPALVDHVVRARTVALVLVRRGGFAMGVAHGESLAASKVGSRHVQGRTKAGGWSQQRYARRRAAQAGTAFVAAADAAVGVLLPHVADLEGLVTGGDRAAVSSVLSDQRLRALAALPQGPFLAVPDPRRRVLEDAVRRSRAVRIEVFDPDLDARP
jgi:Actinobacteria/chloroflexi VLRF1 release factor